MFGHLANFIPGCGVPNLDGVIVGSADQQFAIGAKVDIAHRTLVSL